MTRKRYTWPGNVLPISEMGPGRSGKPNCRAGKPKCHFGKRGGRWRASVGVLNSIFTRGDDVLLAGFYFQFGFTHLCWGFEGGVILLQGQGFDGAPVAGIFLRTSIYASLLAGCARSAIPAWRSWVRVYGVRAMGIYRPPVHGARKVHFGKRRGRCRTSGWDIWARCKRGAKGHFRKTGVNDVRLEGIYGPAVKGARKLLFGKRGSMAYERWGYIGPR